MSVTAHVWLVNRYIQIGDVRVFQVSRKVLPWKPKGSPEQCCHNCQEMLEGIENKCVDDWHKKFKFSIGHVTEECIPSVTPLGTYCSTPSTAESPERSAQE